MGQSKSKTWRRLSEPDCLHLLHEQQQDNLNSHNQSNCNTRCTLSYVCKRGGSGCGGGGNVNNNNPSATKFHTLTAPIIGDHHINKNQQHNNGNDGDGGKTNNAFEDFLCPFELSNQRIRSNSERMLSEDQGDCSSAQLIKFRNSAKFDDDFASTTTTTTAMNCQFSTPAPTTSPLSNKSNNLLFITNGNNQQQQQKNSNLLDLTSSTPTKEVMIRNTKLVDRPPALSQFFATSALPFQNFKSDLLLNGPTKKTKLSFAAEVIDTSIGDMFAKKNSLIESPPPLSPSTMPTIASPTPIVSPPVPPPPHYRSVRPITMYQFDDPFDGVGEISREMQLPAESSSLLVQQTNQSLHVPVSNAVSAAAAVSVSQLERHALHRGLSLSDLLEQYNQFNNDDEQQQQVKKGAKESATQNDEQVEDDDDEEDEEFSDQTMVSTPLLNCTDDDTLKMCFNDNHKLSGRHENGENLNCKMNSKSDSCLSTDLSTTKQGGDGGGSGGGGNVNVNGQSKSLMQSSTIRCSGLDCICDRCVQQRFKLLNWLLPNCTRINAERLLHGRLEGTFLVRKSEKFPGQYTLSFVCRRTVRHCLIMRSVYGFGLRWPYSFETLQQVIIHYARTTLAEFNSKLDVRLRYPVFMS